MHTFYLISIPYKYVLKLKLIFNKIFVLNDKFLHDYSIKNVNEIFKKKKSLSYRIVSHHFIIEKFLWALK